MMVERDQRPEAGGNTDQPDDGRDERGRLPEPLDSAHYPPVDGGPAIVLPGQAMGQPAGTGPVVSSPAPPQPEPAEEPPAGLTTASFAPTPPAEQAKTVDEPKVRTSTKKSEG